jgi:hypothetical protein
MGETAEWRRSSFCTDSACAEIKVDGDSIHLRSTNRPESVVELTRSEWEALKKAVRDGEF